MSLKGSQASFNETMSGLRGRGEGGADLDGDKMANMKGADSPHPHVLLLAVIHAAWDDRDLVPPGQL